MSDARKIYQDHLETVTQAIWSGDFDTLTGLMAYPHDLVVTGKTVTVHSPEELRAWAETFRASLFARGATAYHRETIAAAFGGEDETRIDGFHRIFVLDGGKLLVEPYSSEATLERRGDDWLCTGVRAVLREPRYQIAEEED